MPWLEIWLVTGIWLTVKGWRRWRRSGRGGDSFPPSSRSSRPTVRNPSSLADQDPARIAHDGSCEWCGAQTVVPLTRTRLERHPWRLVWWCSVCGRQARAHCPPDLVPVFVRWETAGGMSLSMREVADMVSVDLDELNRAIEEELG
jgi:hypothetical protein